jgi:hypothetical protein
MGAGRTKRSPLDVRQLQRVRRTPRAHPPGLLGQHSTVQMAQLSLLPDVPVKLAGDGRGASTRRWPALALSMRQRGEAPGFPSNRGDFLIADSCDFAGSSVYRTPVHFVPRAFTGDPGHGAPDAPRRGWGQAGPARFSWPWGRRRLSAQGRTWRVPVPGSWPVRGCPAVTAGLDAEGRPGILARRVPRPQRGSPLFKVSGGEAASCWLWAAQRPARSHAASFPASARS